MNVYVYVWECVRVCVHVCTRVSMRRDECVCVCTLVSVSVHRHVHVCESMYAGMAVSVPKQKAKRSERAWVITFCYLEERINIVSWAKTWCSGSRLICKSAFLESLELSVGSLSTGCALRALSSRCPDGVVSAQWTGEYFAPWWGVCTWCHVPSTCFVRRTPNEKKTPVSTTWN